MSTHLYADVRVSLCRRLHDVKAVGRLKPIGVERERDGASRRLHLCVSGHEVYCGVGCIDTHTACYTLASIFIHLCRDESEGACDWFFWGRSGGALRDRKKAHKRYTRTRMAWPMSPSDRQQKASSAALLSYNQVYVPLSLKVDCMHTHALSSSACEARLVSRFFLEDSSTERSFDRRILTRNRGIRLCSWPLSLSLQCLLLLPRLVQVRYYSVSRRPLSGCLSKSGKRGWAGTSSSSLPLLSLLLSLSFLSTHIELCFSPSLSS